MPGIPNRRHTPSSVNSSAMASRQKQKSDSSNTTGTLNGLHRDSNNLSRRKAKYERILDGRYRMQRTIGTGNFAKVKLATHLLTNEDVAIKIIDKHELSSSSLKKLSREVNLMQLLDHPNIVRLYEIIETEKMMYLVMEYASNGELYEYLSKHDRMNENEARKMFRQILSAVEYCHQKQIIHRDLKTENLLLDANMNIKLADFGFANNFEVGKKLSTYCGSPPYAAPELFQGKEYFGPEVDVWSLGVILFKLVSGNLPFDGQSLPHLRECVLRGKYRIPYFMSRNCEMLLRKMLLLDSSKRKDLTTLMSDRWVNTQYENDPLEPYVEPQATSIDSVRVNKLLDLGFSLDEIFRSIKRGAFDKVTATYHLLGKQKPFNHLTTNKDDSNESIKEKVDKTTPVKVLNTSMEQLSNGGHQLASVLQANSQETNRPQRIKLMQKDLRKRAPKQNGELTKEVCIIAIPKAPSVDLVDKAEPPKITVESFDEVGIPQTGAHPLRISNILEEPEEYGGEDYENVPMVRINHPESLDNYQSPVGSGEFETLKKPIHAQNKVVVAGPPAEMSTFKRTLSMSARHPAMESWANRRIQIISECENKTQNKSPTISITNSGSPTVYPLPVRMHEPAIESFCRGIPTRQTVHAGCRADKQLEEHGVGEVKNDPSTRPRIDLTKLDRSTNEENEVDCGGGEGLSKEFIIVPEINESEKLYSPNINDSREQLSSKNFLRTFTTRFNKRNNSRYDTNPLTDKEMHNVHATASFPSPKPPPRGSKSFRSDSRSIRHRSPPSNTSHAAQSPWSDGSSQCTSLSTSIETKNDKLTKEHGWNIIRFFSSRFGSRKHTDSTSSANSSIEGSRNQIKAPPSTPVQSTAHNHHSLLHDPMPPSILAATKPLGSEELYLTDNRLSHSYVHQESSQDSAYSLNLKNEQDEQGLYKPRNVRFGFSVKATCDAPEEDLLSMLKLNLQTLRCTYTQPHTFVLICDKVINDGTVSFEMEICRTFSGMLGIQFKRLSGSNIAFKTVMKALLQNLQLAARNAGFRFDIRSV